jgi:hypothetical protein
MKGKVRGRQLESATICAQENYFNKAFLGHEPVLTAVALVAFV